MIVEFKMVGAGLACSGLGGVGQGQGIGGRGIGQTYFRLSSTMKVFTLMIILIILCISMYVLWSTHTMYASERMYTRVHAVFLTRSICEQLLTKVNLLGDHEAFLFLRRLQVNLSIEVLETVHSINFSVDQRRLIMNELHVLDVALETCDDTGAVLQCGIKSMRSFALTNPCSPDANDHLLNVSKYLYRFHAGYQHRKYS